jgi:hypothetical protein
MHGFPIVNRFPTVTAVAFNNPQPLHAATVYTYIPGAFYLAPDDLPYIRTQHLILWSLPPSSGAFHSSVPYQLALRHIQVGGVSPRPNAACDTLSTPLSLGGGEGGDYSPHLPQTTVLTILTLWYGVTSWL